MFIAVQFIRAQNWKQPKCQPTSEWIVWYILLMDEYSAIERNKLPIQHRQISKALY